MHAPCDAARARTGAGHRSAPAAHAGLQHDSGPLPGDGGAGRASTSWTATSSRWSWPSGSPPPSGCRRSRSTGALRRLNPSPFLFYLDLAGVAVVGIQSRDPGARARRNRHRPADRRDPTSGARTARTTSPTNANSWPTPRSAPNTSCCWNLGRNDVGRVSVPGSVRVTEQMIVERYSPRDAYRLQRRRRSGLQARRHRRADGGLFRPAP